MYYMGLTLHDSELITPGYRTLTLFQLFSAGIKFFTYKYYYNTGNWGLNFLKHKQDQLHLNPALLATRQYF